MVQRFCCCLTARTSQVCVLVMAISVWCLHVFPLGCLVLPEVSDPQRWFFFATVAFSTLLGLCFVGILLCLCCLFMKRLNNGGSPGHVPPWASSNSTTHMVFTRFREEDGWVMGSHILFIHLYILYCWHETMMLLCVCVIIIKTGHMQEAKELASLFQAKV